VIGVLLFLSGKSYYSAGAYPMLMAAGGGGVFRKVDRRIPPAMDTNNDACFDGNQHNSCSTD